MMKRVFKYELGSQVSERIKMAAGCEFLSVQLQDGQACLWALIDDEAPMKDTVIYRIGTGWGADKMDGAKYISTVQDGPFVWHFFGEQ